MLKKYSISYALRKMPAFTTAHTFCASGRCLLIQGYFAVYDYARKEDLRKVYWNQKRKLGVTTLLSCWGLILRLNLELLLLNFSEDFKIPHSHKLRKSTSLIGSTVLKFFVVWICTSYTTNNRPLELLQHRVDWLEIVENMNSREPRNILQRTEAKIWTGVQFRIKAKLSEF